MKPKNYIQTVIISIAAAVFPVWLSAQGVRLTPGSYMIMNGPVNLVLNNAGFITDGGFKQGTSTIIFTGNATVQPLLGSSNTTAFNHVTINRPSNDVQLNGDIAIEGTLTMIMGNLQLNSRSIDLGSTGNISGESNWSHITGTSGSVRKTAILNAPQAVNPGNIGVALTSAANLGQTVIERGHLQQSLPGVGLGIQRYFTIMPTNNVAVNGTLRFYYLDTELAGIDENALTLWSGADVGGYWLLTGKDNSDAVSNYVVKSGLDHFNSYTLAPGAVSQLLRVSNDVTTKASPTDFSSAQTSVRVYPNPLQEQFVVALVCSEEKEYVISLYNQYGQLLQSKKPLCRKGMNQIYWNMSDYAKGVYFVVFQNRELQNIKIIKR